jgi:hypothetical protein
MGIVTMECPFTGEQVRTGIMTDAARFERRAYYRQPFSCECGHVHALDGRKAQFDPREDGQRPFVFRLRQV